MVAIIEYIFTNIFQVKEKTDMSAYNAPFPTSCQTPAIRVESVGSLRDAPLAFQGGRKFSEKKNPPRHEGEKKSSPLAGEKKNHPCV